MTSLQRQAHRAYLWLGALAVFAPLAREVDPFRVTDSVLSLSQFLALELGFALSAFFCRAAARGRAGAHMGAMLACAALSAATTAWTAWFLGTDAALFLEVTPLVTAVACLLTGLVLLAAYRAAGWPLVLIIAGFFLYGVMGTSVTALPAQIANKLNYLVYGSEGLLGRALDIIVSMVLGFVVFGAFFEISGGGRAITTLAARMTRNSPSGGIKASVVASGLFGAVSGAATSNVLTSGAYSLPFMRAMGVRNETAAGVEAAASTCGQIMPPVMGAAAFYLADLAGVSYFTVALAGLIPALLCYLAMFRQADLVPLTRSSTEAHILQDRPRASWLLYILPPATIVACLSLAGAYLQIAAIAGTAICLLIAPPLLGWAELWDRLTKRLETLIRDVLHLVVVAGAIGLLLGILHETGLAVAAAIWINALGQSSLIIALVLTAAATIVAGLGMATVGVYIIAGSILAPELIEAGVPPLAAHFFVLYCGVLSMITPPVAFASLAASTLAGASFGATAREALKFGWILFVMPFAIVAQPGLLLLGDWLEIAAAVAVTAAFIWAATDRTLALMVRAVLTFAMLACLLGAPPPWLSFLAAIATASTFYLAPKFRLV